MLNTGSAKKSFLFCHYRYMIRWTVHRLYDITPEYILQILHHICIASIFKYHNRIIFMLYYHNYCEHSISKPWRHPWRHWPGGSWRRCGDAPPYTWRISKANPTYCGRHRYSPGRGDNDNIRRVHIDCISMQSVAAIHDICLIRYFTTHAFYVCQSISL